MNKPDTSKRMNHGSVLYMILIVITRFIRVIQKDLLFYRAIPKYRIWIPPAQGRGRPIKSAYDTHLWRFPNKGVNRYKSGLTKADICA
jgi:hypothetical protein